MNDTPPLEAIETTAAAFRRAFDLSFALPPPAASPEVEDLLMIRVAGDPYAIRLSDIAGMVTARKVVSLPAATPDLLGLAGIRGAIVPVFGLASILGYGPVPDAPRWMILCGGAEETIALAFSDFEGHVRLPKSCLHSSENADQHADRNHRATRQYVNQIAKSTGLGVRAVIGIPLVAATIRKRIGRSRPTKEQ